MSEGSCVGLLCRSIG